MSESVAKFPYFEKKSNCLGNRILSTVSDAIITVDLNLIICSWNNAAEKIYGWLEEEAVGKNFIDFFVPEALESIFENGFCKLMSQNTWSYESCQFSKEGRPLTILCSVNALYDANGELSGFVSVNRDISERINAENELRIQNELLKKIAWTHAHTLRAPVATMLGLSQIFNREDPADPFNAVVIDKMEQVALQLDMVIRGIVGKTQSAYRNESVAGQGQTA